MFISVSFCRFRQLFLIGLPNCNTSPAHSRFGSNCPSFVKTPSWEELRGLVCWFFILFSLLVPHYVSYASVGILKHCQDLLIFSFISVNRDFFAFPVIKVENQFMDFSLVWEGRTLSKRQRLQRIKIVSDVLKDYLE